MAKAAEVLGISEAVAVAKWAGLAKWGAAVGVVGALGFLGLRTFEADEPRSSASIVTPSVEEKLSNAAPEAEVPPPNAPELLDEPVVVPAPRAPLRPKPAASASIAEELELMQAARIALSAGQSSKALTLVGDYRKRFVRPTFGEEATVIRILALAGSGQRPLAVREARSFLERHPKSPHAPRLRALVEP